MSTNFDPEFPVSTGQDLEIELDFTRVQRSAEGVRTMLLDLRRRFNLTPFEFCKKVRIAPTEIPHSHPRITLNTWIRDDLGLLSTYVHEQLHWYETWFSHVHNGQWGEILNRLRQRYPTVPVGGADGGRDEDSTYLHLIVNWLEIDVTARFVDRTEVERHVRALPFYRWCYETVIADREPLGALYEEQGLLPIRRAGEMTPADLELAALETK